MGEINRILRLEEIKSLFETYIKTGDTASQEKAIKIGTNLCMSPFYPIDDKLMVFRSMVRYCPDVTNDILARWRDSLKFIEGDTLNRTLRLVIQTIKTVQISSHEKIYTAVHLYNSGFIDVCYPCFSEIVIDKSMPIDYRLEASKFLLASGEKNDYEISKQFLLEFISDHFYSDEMRYTTIVSFISKTGLVTQMNFQRLNIPYNEELIFSLQMPFFSDKQNKLYWRALSGQSLLQLSIKFDKKFVTDQLFSVAKDPEEEYSIRVDCLDILLRLGDEEERLIAEQMLNSPAFSGRSENKLPMMLYDNEQNIHNKTISEELHGFISKMMENRLESFSYHDVNQEIRSFTRVVNLSDNDRHAVYKALLRISVDTAVFTDKEVTSANILTHVWSRIHSGEFSKEIVETLERRMIEELIDMSDTCSSGYAGRLVNVLSMVDETLKISWADQIASNVKGRLLSRIRDCSDPDLAASIALGMMEGADSKDSQIYREWLAEQITQIDHEMYKEFVNDGYISSKEFRQYFDEIRSSWMIAAL